jgi:hypothetical protein
MDVRFGYRRGGRDGECDWRKLELFLASPRLLNPWGKVLWSGAVMGLNERHQLLISLTFRLHFISFCTSRKH